MVPGVGVKAPTANVITFVSVVIVIDGPTSSNVRTEILVNIYDFDGK